MARVARFPKVKVWPWDSLSVSLLLEDPGTGPAAMVSGRCCSRPCSEPASGQVLVGRGRQHGTFGLPGPHCSCLGFQAVNITDLSRNKDQDKRFTFILSDSGPTTRFESAACPGWFLCTALEADRPVSLTNTPEEDRMVTKFYFQKD